MNELHVDDSMVDKALEVYGSDVQKIIVMEELSELSQAVAKSFRGEKSFDRENLVEEVADVMISLDYLLKIFDITDEEMQKKIDRKLVRLGVRILNDKEVTDAKYN